MRTDILPPHISLPVLEEHDPASATVLLVFLLFVTSAVAHAATSHAFARPQELEHDVAFWRRIYTKVTTSGGLLHDPGQLDVLYEVVQFPNDLQSRSRSKRVAELNKKYAYILERLATTDESSLTEKEKRVLDLWPKGTASFALRAGR